MRLAGFPLDFPATQWTTRLSNTPTRFPVKIENGAMVGVATETDAASSVGHAFARIPGLSTETETASSLGKIKLKSVQPCHYVSLLLSYCDPAATETDSAIARLRATVLTVGRADEIDTAYAPGAAAPAATSGEWLVVARRRGRR